MAPWRKMRRSESAGGGALWCMEDEKGGWGGYDSIMERERVKDSMGEREGVMTP